MTFKTCPNHDELAGYVFGTLAEESAESIADHVESCPECDATVSRLEEAATDTLVSKLREASQRYEFSDDTPCERIVRLIEAIGREPFSWAGV
jgi:hypothetical protein